MSHAEVHYVHRVGWLRAAVLGANDGIISTASLIVGRRRRRRPQRDPDGRLCRMGRGSDGDGRWRICFRELPG